jgi:hypothetical protein
MISRSQWITNEQRFNWARNQGQSKSADCQLRLWMMKGPDMQMVCITLRDDCFQLMVSVIATVDRISSRLQRIVTKIVSLPGIFTNWTDRTRFIRCVTHYHQELNQPDTIFNRVRSFTQISFKHLAGAESFGRFSKSLSCHWDSSYWVHTNRLCSQTRYWTQTVMISPDKPLRISELERISLKYFKKVRFWKSTMDQISHVRSDGCMMVWPPSCTKTYCRIGVLQNPSQQAIFTSDWTSNEPKRSNKTRNEWMNL